MAPATVKYIAKNEFRAHDIDYKIGDFLELDPQDSVTLNLLADDMIVAEETVAQIETEPYILTADDIANNPAYAENGLKEGDEIQVPKKPDVPPVAAAMPPVEEAAPVAEEPQKRFIDGQLVIKDGFRTVGEQTFRHIQLADGSTQDLSEADYHAKVKLAYAPVN